MADLREFDITDLSVGLMDDLRNKKKKSKEVLEET